jgi:epoxyqueuosine reductase
LDARKCISYLTIEHKSQIPLEFRKRIGNRIYGCDDCLAICPWNKFAKESEEIKFSSEKNITDLSLSNLSSFNDQDFRIFFSGSPIKRIGRDRFLRNVLIAIGNSNNKKLAKKAIANINDKSSLVRGAAIWAIRRLLNNSELKKIKENSLSKEKDLSVISEWKNEIN